MNAAIYLVRSNGRIDYTYSATPEPVRAIKPGRKGGPQGDWIMSKKHADHLTAMLKMVGPTIALRESLIKVPAYEVEIVAGPFVAREEPSDNPDYPQMTRTVVETGAGEVAWSNNEGRYILPDGRACSSLAAALSLALDLS